MIMAGSAVGESLSNDQVIARRRLPVGAEILDHRRVHWRVWAPDAERVHVVSSGASGEIELSAEPDGYFSAVGPGGPGDRYQFRLNRSDRLLPDPASRFQPEGPHGPSQIVDPSTFQWTDQQWPGVSIEGQIIYEMHPGTFTREGTWAAAAGELPELAALGITLVELMPVAEFDGEFGWGYDGVDLFAPYHRYGTPDDLRRFVDSAHRAGLGVILDVVYNHLGPSGNYLREFSKAYFTDRYENEWGDAINFDGDGSGPVREFFVANAGYWIDEYHLDGLRLDATQQIFDSSSENVMTVVGARVRQKAGARGTIIVAENEPQEPTLVRPTESGGHGLDALWNDDFHHSAIVALTGRAEAYYTDTRGDPQEFVSAAKYGYLFQGQYYHWQRQTRGMPALDIPPSRFIVYLENHDQVANSARGVRGHQLTSPARWRAMTAALLLWPGTPMLFQGQEFSSSAPFLYFAHHDEQLAAAVRAGRAEFLKQFSSVIDYVRVKALDDPADRATFERCKLDFSERARHAASYALHKDLLALRRNDPAFMRPSLGGIDGAVLTPHAFALRYFTDDHAADRVVIVNLGSDISRNSFAEPLLAPPEGRGWTLQWSSEDPAYGGAGTPNPWPEGRWCLPAESTVVLAPAAPRPGGKPHVRRRTA
jgi:maltooligosyltrehalose trehalohydrolase